MQHATQSAFERAVGVIRFDRAALAALARDPGGTAQAALVVGMVSLALGVSQAIDSWLVLAVVLAGAVLVVRREPRSASLAPRHMVGHLDARAMHRRSIAHVQRFLPLPGIVIGIGAAALGLLLVLRIPAILVPIVAWFIFSGVAWFAVNTLVGHPHTRVAFAPLLRATGFSIAPIALASLTVVPLVGAVAIPLAVVWTFLLLVFSIRHTAHLGTGRALLATIPASLAALAVVGPLVAILSV